MYARFKDNLWVRDLAEIGKFFSKFHGVKYLLCVVDVFIKNENMIKQFFIVLLKY